jgi:hypothetical protein
MAERAQTGGGVEGQLRELEAKTAAVLLLVARLKKEKAELANRLAEAAKVRRELESRINSLLDKIDSLP